MFLIGVGLPVCCELFPARIVQAQTCRSGVTGVIDILGPAWLGDTFIKVDSSTTVRGLVYDLVLVKGWLTEKRLDDLPSASKITDPRQRRA
jgi:anaerobic C4-dicarboxylate transporter